MVSYQFHIICYELLSQKSRDQKVRALFRDEPRRAGLCPEGLSRSRRVRSPEIPGVSCDRHGQAGRRKAHRGDIPAPGCWGRSVPEVEHGELQLPTMQVPACMLRLRRELFWGMHTPINSNTNTPEEARGYAPQVTLLTITISPWVVRPRILIMDKIPYRDKGIQKQMTQLVQGKQ